MLAPDDLYLDHNATSPLLPEVRECLSEALACAWANPASTHTAGRRARDRLERARRQVAILLDSEPESLTFTSGGTEANHMALLGQLPRNRPAHLVVSAIEHSSVLESAALAESLGHRVTHVAPAADGRMEVESLLRALQPETAVVCLMSANNETGVRQPVAELGAALEARGPVGFHVDAVQSLGREPCDWRQWRCTTAAWSGHKIGAPAGIGVLATAPDTRLEAWQRGGQQERGRRGGTPNFLGALGLGAAAEALLARPRPPALARDRFESLLQELQPDLRWNGREVPRLANTSSLTVPGVSAAVLLEALTLRGVHAATGSACQAGAADPSHVLRAMGRSLADRRGSIRVSFGPEDRADQGERAAQAFHAALSQIRTSGRGAP